MMANGATVQASTSREILGAKIHLAITQASLKNAKMLAKLLEPGAKAIDCKDDQFFIPFGLYPDVEAREAAIEMRVFRSDEIEDMQLAAADYNNVASAFLRVECPDRARDVYLLVIDKFVGEAYAAARQRARIGIDDIREAKSHQK